MNKEVLFLVSCSNHKLEGGTNQFDSRNALWNSLHGESKDYLLESRKAAISHIRRGGLTRNGKKIVDLPYNVDLRMGGDFEGTEKGAFLPAYKRYSGRLYKEISEVSWEKRSQDILIMSALYGLLVPEEPIQRYSLHLRDSRVIGDLWESGLTLVLAEYVRRHSIRAIVDCLGEDLYRDVFDWGYLQGTADVFHVYGTQNAGPPLLSAIGCFLESFGLPSGEETLQALLRESVGEYETPYEKLLLLRKREDAARIGLPLEDGYAFQANEKRKVPHAEMPAELSGIDKRHGIQLEFTFKVLEQWKELPGDVRQKVLRILTEFLVDPEHPGLRAEIINVGKERILRIRIDRSYRMHLQKEGKVLFIRAIGPHRLEGIG